MSRRWVRVNYQEAASSKKGGRGLNIRLWPKLLPICALLRHCPSAPARIGVTHRAGNTHSTPRLGTG